MRWEDVFAVEADHGKRKKKPGLVVPGRESNVRQLKAIALGGVGSHGHFTRSRARRPTRRR